MDGSATDDLPGLDLERVGRWLEGAGVGPAPFTPRLIAAGGSNLTYEVLDGDGQRHALRRPPVGRALATAHDVLREWQVLTALDDFGGFPVPEPVALCRDDDVTGAPFYVMAFADGIILRTADDAEALDPDVLRAAGRALVETQIALHAIDVAAIGLGELGPPTGYVERQLERWRRQYDDGRVRRVHRIEELHQRLSRTVPAATGPPALLHGDYRFDNVVLGEDGKVVAVLDWELCTLGDPVADACWSLQYWADRDDEVAFLPSSPTLAAALPRRSEVIGRYAALSGRPLDDWPWFEVFGWWKMGCIVEGVHARRSKGQTAGGRSGPLASIAARADQFLHVAETKARALGL
jgi:aminoglycoside phosphotransferase (APT) family kinase protein